MRYNVGGTLGKVNEVGAPREPFPIPPLGMGTPGLGRYGGAHMGTMSRRTMFLSFSFVCLSLYL